MPPTLTRRSPLITYKEAAELLKVSERWLRTMVVQNKLRTVLVGGSTVRKVRFLESDVRKLVKSRNERAWARKGETC